MKFSKMQDARYKMQDTRCKMQDKSPHPPFTKGGQGGITKKSWYHASSMFYSVPKFLQLAILIVSLMIPLGGCKKEQVPAKKPIAEQVKPVEVKKEIKAAEEAKEVVSEEYKYDSKGRRDPFLSLVEITKQKPLKKKGATPFESYDIDEIQLMAIAWDKNKYYALIMLPDRKTYTITEGMTMGLMGGKVEKITKDSVVIREYIKDYRGEIKPRDSILKLHKGEEE